jgi:hypothetical protein
LDSLSLEGKEYKMLNAAKFLDLVATPLVEEFRAIEAIKKFTTNTDVIGAHAEATVRRLVARVVHPLRVCTGAVISEELCSNPKKVPQIDTIIWQPSPAPALFEVGDFGLVPRGSAMAIMEIKRSAYKDVGAKLKERLREDLVGKLVADDPPGWAGTNEPVLYPDYPAMGVVCLRETSSRDSNLDELIEKGHSVVLLEIRNDSVTPNTEAVYRLINFLIRARQRAKAWDGTALVNLKAFK